jgi:hypothetical protein
MISNTLLKSLELPMIVFYYRRDLYKNDKIKFETKTNI